MTIRLLSGVPAKLLKHTHTRARARAHTHTHTHTLVKRLSNNTALTHMKQIPGGRNDQLVNIYMSRCVIINTSYRRF